MKDDMKNLAMNDEELMDIDGGNKIGDFLRKIGVLKDVGDAIDSIGK